MLFWYEYRSKLLTSSNGRQLGGVAFHSSLSLYKGVVLNLRSVPISLLHGLPSVLHLQAPNKCKIKVSYPPMNIPSKSELDVSNLFFLLSRSAGRLLARCLNSQALTIRWKQEACTKITRSRQVLPLLYSRSGNSPPAQRNVKSRGLAD